MSKVNPSNLLIKIETFNEVVKREPFMKKIRSLTLNSYSGMNHELNVLSELAQTKDVNCKIISCFMDRKMVGWALFSKEASDFYFTHGFGYQPTDGILFQIFVDPTCRRQGIGSALVKAAVKEAGTETVCFCPWDVRSNSFFENFKHVKHKIL